jgi:hypothetical protein
MLDVQVKYIADPSMHSMPAVGEHPNGKALCYQSLDNQIVTYTTSGRFRQNRKKTFRGHLVAGNACQVCALHVHALHVHVLSVSLLRQDMPVFHVLARACAACVTPVCATCRGGPCLCCMCLHVHALRVHCLCMQHDVSACIRTGCIRTGCTRTSCIRTRCLNCA